MQSTPRDDWMLALSRGDPLAQDRLVREWLPVVVRWCARLGGPAVDPEDAAHEVFLIVLRRLDAVYDADHLGPWLFGITRRVLAAHRRKAWVRRWIPGAVVEAVEPVGPARLAEISEVGERVRVALDRLAPAEREVLVLCLLEERADTEVAQILGIPKNTVKSRLHRARDHFARAARAEGLDVSVGAGEET